MTNPDPIHPTAIYDSAAVENVLGFPASTLARARREGRLRFTRQGPRVIYLGQWLLEWIEREGNATTAPAAGNGGAA